MSLCEMRFDLRRDPGREFLMQLELLGERLAQCTVIVNDQYSAASPHHFSRRTAHKRGDYARELRNTSPALAGQLLNDSRRDFQSTV